MLKELLMIVFLLLIRRLKREKMKRYKYWDIYEELPKGWKVDKYADAPLGDCVFIVNGSKFKKGFQRVLLRVKNKYISF